MNISIQDPKCYRSLGMIGVQGSKPSQYTKPRRLSIVEHKLVSITSLINQFEEHNTLIVVITDRFMLFLYT